MFVHNLLVLNRVIHLCKQNAYNESTIVIEQCMRNITSFDETMDEILFRSTSHQHFTNCLKIYKTMMQSIISQLTMEQQIERAICQTEIDKIDTKLRSVSSWKWRFYKCCCGCI